MKSRNILIVGIIVLIALAIILVFTNSSKEISNSKGSGGEEDSLVKVSSGTIGIASTLRVLGELPSSPDSFIGGNGITGGTIGMGSGSSSLSNGPGEITKLG